MKLANVFLLHNAYLLLISGILFLYGLIPLVIGIFVLNDPYFGLLSKLTIIAALGIFMALVTVLE